MDSDRTIDVLASRQHGVFSREQAERADVTRSMIRRRLESGAWIRLAPGVYAVASAPPKWERQLAAAVLSQPEAIVAGASAAHLLGFEGFRKGRPEIVVPYGANARSPIARVTRSIWYDQLGTTRAAGFTVTSEPETLLTLAGRIAVDRLEALVDDRIAAGRLMVDDFEGIRRRISSGRVKGSRPLLSLLDERGAEGWQPPKSELERLLGRLAAHPSVPAASRQHPFGFDNAPMIVDIYIAEWRLILEADGRRWHTRRADFERDRARDNAAAAQGLVVLRFTWRMLTRDFDGCLRTLLATGLARSA